MGVHRPVLQSSAGVYPIHNNAVTATAETTDRKFPIGNCFIGVPFVSFWYVGSFVGFLGDSVAEFTCHLFEEFYFFLDAVVSASVEIHCQSAGVVSSDGIYACHIGVCEVKDGATVAMVSDSKVMWWRVWVESHFAHCPSHIFHK